MTDFDVELPYKTAATGRKPDNILCDRNGGVIGSRVGGSNPAASNNGVSLSSPSNILGMDKSTLKVHLPDGSFNVVRFGDATDIKVSLWFHGVAKKIQIGYGVAATTSWCQICARRYFFELNLFARWILLIKNLGIEKTKHTFIMSVLKVEY